MKSNFDNVLIELAARASSRMKLYMMLKRAKCGLSFLSDNDSVGRTTLLIPPHKLVVIKHKNMLKYLQENRGCLDGLYQDYELTTWREFCNEDVENIMYIDI